MDLHGVLLLIGPLGTSEIIFIALLILLLFGAQKIPELARSLGKAQREFNKAREDLENAPPAAETTDDERLRRAARDLGLRTEGRTPDELREEIAKALEKKTP